MKLVISLPTRGRPDRVVDTVTRSIANWALPNTVMWVMADSDDQPTIDAFNANVPKWNNDRVKLSVKDRELTIGAKWNRVLSLDQGDVYLAGADDDPYITPAYDAKILEAASLFPDGIGMVYGHLANASFSKAVAPTAKLVEKMGYLFPEYFPFWFVDHWTDDIAKHIGRISFADVDTDQTRPGKTQEMREPAWWATWFDAAHLIRRRIAHAIIRGDDFDAPAWQKQMLVNQYPLVEWRSRWVNEHVRAQAPALERWSGLKNNDARYQQLRAQAVAMVPQMLDEMDPRKALEYRRILTPPTVIPALPRAYG